MNHTKYILDEHGAPHPCADLLTWARWYEGAERVISKDWIGESIVSTVFLGLDHSFKDGAAPVLWETIVFGGPLNEQQDRCSGSREQAEAMHAAMVERVRSRSPE